MSASGFNVTHATTVSGEPFSLPPLNANLSTVLSVIEQKFVYALSSQYTHDNRAVWTTSVGTVPVVRERL